MCIICKDTLWYHCCRCLGCGKRNDPEVSCGGKAHGRTRTHHRVCMHTLICLLRMVTKQQLFGLMGGVMWSFYRCNIIWHCCSLSILSNISNFLIHDQHLPQQRTFKDCKSKVNQRGWTTVFQRGPQTNVASTIATSEAVLPSSCWLMMTDWRGRICEERKGERKGRERREGNLVCRRSSVEWKGGRKWMSGWVSGWGPMHIWCLQNFAIFRPLSLCPHYLTDLYYKIQRYPRNRATHNRSNRILVQNLVGPNHQNGL